ncbi:MAG: LPS assembly protein LptD [Archangium sp.]
MLGLLLALAICAEPEAAEPEATSQVQLTAARLLHDGKKLITNAEGDAKLITTDGSAIDADRIVYDQNRRVATATGHVIARLTRGGKIGVIADLVTVRFDENDELTDVYLYDGRAISKKDVTREAFLAADTEEKLEKAGTTQALLTGNHLQRNGNDWTVEELELVPCECDFKNPSWSISSSTAVIDTDDDRVSITNPVVRIKGVPVLWLPWLSLPLTDRQSGILFPKPNYSALNGFQLEQPVYFTLGRSADLTLTPGFFTGGTAVYGTPRAGNGVAGPRLGTEFRYAPSARASGTARLGLLYDFSGLRDVEGGTRVAGTQRGWRGELSWQHTQDFDHGFGARVDFNGHSDGDYNRDLTVDVILSTATYLRSSATAFHRGANHSLTLDVGLRQDIQWGYDWLGNGTLLVPSRVIGNFGPGTLQRLPALTFGWTPDPLGPVRFTLDAEAVRLAPLFSNTGDEGSAAAEGAILPTAFTTGVARLFNPSSPAALVTSGMGDRVWESGEREARDRLMIKPTLSAAFSPLGAMTISASASWRQLAWAGEASGRTWARGYLLLGGAIETQLARRFFDGALRHVIEPRVEVRALPFGFASGASTFVPYDQVDFAVPNVSPRVQAIAELRQKFQARDGTEVFRLEIGQGGEFAMTPASTASLTPVLGETYGRATFRVGWLSGQGAMRIDPLASRLASDGTTAITTGLTRASARVDLDDGRGHGAYGTYENLLMEGTARSRQPLDLLFLIDRGFTSTTRVQQIMFGARWNFGPLGLRYDALIAEQAFAKGPTLAFSQHALSVGITPACDCWRLDLTATQPIPWVNEAPKWLVPQVGFSLSVQRFGTIGAR